MKKLHELMTLVSNTEDAVVLKIKEGSEMDLICLGCFDGDETLIRLTKGRNQTCTIWTKDNKHDSWMWGDSGYTLVSQNTSRKGHMIQQAIEDGFDILVHGSSESIKKDMLNNSGEHHIELWHRGGLGRGAYGCRKDDEFFRSFDSLEGAIEHFKSLGYSVKPEKEEPNYCNSITHYFTLKKED